MSLTHVVVDNSDGYVYWRDSTGQPFNAERAREFADKRNSDRKPGRLTYTVHELHEPGDTADVDLYESRHDLLRTLLLEHEHVCGCTAHKPCETRTGVVQWIRDITQTVFREK